MLDSAVSVSRQPSNAVVWPGLDTGQWPSHLFVFIGCRTRPIPTDSWMPAKWDTVADQGGKYSRHIRMKQINKSTPPPRSHLLPFSSHFRIKFHNRDLYGWQDIQIRVEKENGTERTSQNRNYYEEGTDFSDWISGFACCWDIRSCGQSLTSRQGRARSNKPRSI